MSFEFQVKFAWCNGAFHFVIPKNLYDKSDKVGWGSSKLLISVTAPLGPSRLCGETTPNPVCTKKHSKETLPGDLVGTRFLTKTHSHTCTRARKSKALPERMIMRNARASFPNLNLKST